jgi:hypothetical protein
MKKVFFFLAFVSLSIASISQKTANIPSYANESFVIFEAKAIKVADLVYVKQIKGRDFAAGDNSKIAGFSIGEDTYTDNGQGNDAVANDGLFTSVDTYKVKEDKGKEVTLQRQKFQV